MSLVETVIGALKKALLEAPAHTSWERFLGGRSLSYRERLDRQPVNVYGDPIPRITTVRRNLRMLRKPQQRPRLPQ